MRWNNIYISGVIKSEKLNKTFLNINKTTKVIEINKNNLELKYLNLEVKELENNSKTWYAIDKDNYALSWSKYLTDTSGRSNIKYDTPQKISNTIKFVKIAAGESKIFLLSSEGYIYQCLENKIKLLSEHIFKDIQSYNNNFLFLDVNNNTFTITKSNNLKKIRHDEVEKANNIFCGYYYQSDRYLYDIENNIISAKNKFKTIVRNEEDPFKITLGISTDNKLFYWSYSPYYEYHEDLPNITESNAAEYAKKYGIINSYNNYIEKSYTPLKALETAVLSITSIDEYPEPTQLSENLYKQIFKIDGYNGPCFYVQDAENKIYAFGYDYINNNICFNTYIGNYDKICGKSDFYLTQQNDLILLNNSEQINSNIDIKNLYDNILLVY